VNLPQSAVNELVSKYRTSEERKGIYFVKYDVRWVSILKCPTVLST